MTDMTERFWICEREGSWQQVTVEQFINAERRAGFRPKTGNGVATGGFSGSGLQGRITYGEEYGFDPEFLAVAKQTVALEKLRSLVPISGTDKNFNYEKGVPKDSTEPDPGLLKFMRSL